MCHSIEPLPPHQSGPVPSVSVVIPCYNYARFIERAIRSVLSQDETDFEILVIDDGSTDETQTIVQAVRDPRIRYIYQSNAGLSAARNTGISEARSALVGFLDADDEWTPTHLSATLSVFRRLPADFAMVASVAIRIDGESRPLATRLPSTCRDHEIQSADLVVKNRFMPSAVVARKATLIDCGGFNTALRSSEDRDMWIRIGMRARIYVHSAQTVRVRKHSSNMSKQADRMSQSMRTVLHQAYQWKIVPAHNLGYWSKAWALYYFQMAWMLHDEGRLTEAIRYAFAAIAVRPLPLSAAALNEPPFFRLRALTRFLSLIPGRRGPGS